MSLTLLLPLGLAALAALAIPLLLHLNRRQQQRAILFAALRWIAAPAQPRRRLRLEQWPLLLLRLLLLAAVALLLARPFGPGAGHGARDWVVVVPGVDAAAARARLSAGAAQWHWLQPGFPALDTVQPGPADARDVASLLRELDSELDPATRLHVIVPSVVRGLDGGAIALSRAVDWLSVDLAPAGPAAPRQTPVQKISLRRSGDAPGEVYLQAAVSAWNEDGEARYRLEREDAAAAIDAATAYVFWLGGDLPPPLQHWVEAGGTALLAQAATADFATLVRDGNGNALLKVRTLGQGRLLAFAAAPQPALLPALLDAQFPEWLLLSLRQNPLRLDQASAAAVQPVTGAPRGDAGLHDLGLSLALLIALLALAERALSFFYARRRA
ncbi:putative membrane protein (TIGR02226 family) [Tahibacter aquaticus]|uniref:Putative membrane protein (TIGR02226 family) n=1 Tax=Tahibacter aquaticus TaxID=520092 RepID=A0A4R6YVB3_9GAMM|nr:BatA domain-containing protein [Tahibacter aquaticus]TDR42607.1 putative membrane protein (TIGR02226 family) [Tahibacter aquaticus]